MIMSWLIHVVRQKPYASYLLAEVVTATRAIPIRPWLRSLLMNAKSSMIGISGNPPALRNRSAAMKIAWSP